MAQANLELVELVLTKLRESDELLDRFLESPVTVIAEFSDTPVDQATLEAIGDELRKLYSESDSANLTDEQLDEVAGGFSFHSRIWSWKPIIGRISGGSGVISNVQSFTSNT